MLSPDFPEGYASDRPDPSAEWWHLWEKLPAVDRERTRSLGYLHEPRNRDGAEPDGIGEEDQRRRKQIATLRRCGSTGEVAYWFIAWSFSLIHSRYYVRVVRIPRPAHIHARSRFIPLVLRVSCGFPFNGRWPRERPRTHHWLGY